MEKVNAPVKNNNKVLQRSTLHIGSCPAAGKINMFNFQFAKSGGSKDCFINYPRAAVKFLLIQYIF